MSTTETASHFDNLENMNVQELLEVLGELASELYEKRKRKSAALPGAPREAAPFMKR